MADWFDFAGTRSTTHGVYVQDFPPLTLPEERAKFETVPGRSGSLTLLEGDAVYDDIVLSIDCFVRDLSQLDAITAWLRGSGNLVLGNMPDRYYKARCVNQIELTKLLRGHQHRTFAAVFRCQPYRYQYPAPSKITQINSSQYHANPGNIASEPIITVFGSGNINLLVGTSAVLITGLDTGSITLDSDARMAYKPGDLTTPMSRYINLIGGKWPTIPTPGTAIQWTGTVSKIEIEPRWRWR